MYTALFGVKVANSWWDGWSSPLVDTQVVGVTRLGAPFSRVRSLKVGHRASVVPLPHSTNPLEAFGNQWKRLEDEQLRTSSIIESVATEISGRAGLSARDT